MYEIYKARAIEKLNGAAKITGRKEQAMADDVKRAMSTFCRQSEEFAQAVVQGGSFEDCLKAVAKDVGDSISDIEAYSKAVKFYFPTATVSFTLTINTEGDNALEDKPSESALNMSLDELLGL